MRVEEVANLTLGVIGHGRNQVMVRCGKGARDRLVYLYNDTAEALASIFTATAGNRRASHLSG
ncbi:MAG: hypothetical protein GY702_25235 [Desulfobulbaceae bacterium]|nr:hypothetical protein [Desulfobulbaceae bacterium]